MGNQTEGPKTIVSVTPLAVLSDSRTFKEAASFSRFGYTSIVVEGEASPSSQTSFSFQLRTIKKRVEGKGEEVSEERTPTRGEKNLRGREKLEASVMRCLSRLPATVKDPLRFGKFLVLFFYENCLFPLKAIPKASLYYLHAPHQFPAICLLSAWHRVPFVYDAHDFYSQMDPHDDLTDFERRWFLSFYRKLESWCVQRAAAVVTVNQGIARMQQKAFHCNPIVIRNCHDCRLDQEPIQPLREHLKLAPEAFLLVSLGHGKRSRAIEEAIDAMLHLPEFVHLAFLGKNYDPYYEYRRVKRLEQRVHFVPPVSPNEVVPFVRSADASLILYYSRSVNDEHSLPNSFFQSIAAELPLLYPELPEISEIAQKHDLGIPINPRIQGSISQAVGRLLRDADERARYRNNLKKVKGILSWEEEEELLKRLLLNVINRSTDRRGMALAKP